MARLHRAGPAPTLLIGFSRSPGGRSDTVRGVVPECNPCTAGGPPGGRRPRVGVALGGGSARGYAHLGVLAALERRGVRPDVVVGTSFGAVIGALYASGRALGELRAQAESLRRRDVFPYILDVGIGRGALLSGNRLEAFFDRLVEGRSFEDCRLPLVVVATDLDSGERVTLRRGPLAPALRASATLPGLFAPVVLEGRRLIDGGIGTPVPLDTLRGEGVDVAIGVGAGVEVRDSRALRATRRALAGTPGAALRTWLHRSGSAGSWGGLARALTLAVDAWAGAPERLAAGPVDGLHVQTRPPISWLRFDRAAAAILAGDAAMELAWPRLEGSIASFGAGD
jgi:NTE family protein